MGANNTGNGDVDLRTSRAYQRRLARQRGTPFQRAVRRGLGVVGWICLFSLLLLAVALWNVTQAYATVRQTIDELVNTELPEGSQVTRIYARDYDPATGRGTLLGVMKGENRQNAGYDELPPQLLASFISTEDKNFFQHSGVDVYATGRAVLRGLKRGGNIRGTSTITQQLARNVYLPNIKSARTLNRKIQEAIFANALEHRFTKQDIIEAYINHVGQGGNVYGAKSAAKRYFDKELKDLTLGECALLAGLPQQPTKYNPALHPEAAEVRRQAVLDTWELRLGTDFFDNLRRGDPEKFKDFNLTREDIEKARQEVPKLKRRSSGGRIYAAPYFTEYLQTEILPDRYNQDALQRQGLIVVTTIDPQIQSWAEAACKEKLAKYRDKLGKRVSQVASIVMDAKSGDVLACVGGAQWMGQTGKGPDMLNRALQSERQVGSSFKPIVYSTAYEQGFPVTTILRDAPYKQVNGKPWPRNSDGVHNGSVSIFYGLQKSKNCSSVDLMVHLTGIPAVIETARRMGISARLPEVESLALGVGEIRPVEMASAFTTFPNIGRHVEQNYIRRVYSPSGLLLENNDSDSAISARSNQAIKRNTAWMMVENLKLCVNNGTGGRARVKGVTICGKTGTCEDFSDAWFCGFSPEVVCVVWCGNDDYHRKMGRMFGGDLPAETFSAIMSKIYANGRYKKTSHTRPDDVEFRGFPGPVKGGAVGTGVKKEGEEEKAGDKKTEDGKTEEDAKNDDNGFYKEWKPPKDGDVFF